MTVFSMSARTFPRARVDMRKWKEAPPRCHALWQDPCFEGRALRCFEVMTDDERDEQGKQGADRGLEYPPRVTVHVVYESMRWRG